jgi:acetoin utilization deacetylase AcuC-like enzyme
VLLRDRLIAKAVVIDCDVHQGNGTASIFAGDARVFTLSLHGAHNFPFRKEVSDLDIVFEDGAGDDEYLRALFDAVPRVLDAEAPDLVFYLAGADPYEGDRLGRLKLTIEGLRRRDAFVLTTCAARGLPVVVAMSGGYAPDIDAIVRIHANTIAEAVRSTQVAHVAAARRVAPRTENLERGTSTLEPRTRTEGAPCPSSMSVRRPPHLR